jgi:hypothetical protein
MDLGLKMTLRVDVAAMKNALVKFRVFVKEMLVSALDTVTDVAWAILFIYLLLCCS